MSLEKNGWKTEIFLKNNQQEALDKVSSYKVALPIKIEKVGERINWRWGVQFWVGAEYLKFTMMVVHLNGYGSI